MQIFQRGPDHEILVLATCKNSMKTDNK